MLGYSTEHNIQFAPDAGGSFGGQSSEAAREASAFARVTPGDLDFSPEHTTPVISAAQKFVIPVPAFGTRGEPLVYPVDPGAPGYDPQKAGQPITDWQGKRIGENGIVFFNAKDRALQAACGDGQAVIIINLVTREQAERLNECIARHAADPADLTLAQLKEVLEFACRELGLSDMYNSDRAFIRAKMTPVGAASKIEAYGLMKRDDRDICRALYIPGCLLFEGPTATPQIFEHGAVILKQGNDVRGIQPAEFEKSYRLADGRAIESAAQALAAQYPSSPS